MNKVTSHLSSGLKKSLAASAALTIFALAVHASTGGIVYVANGGANTVEAINSAGNGTVVATNGLSDPFGLALDNAGNLYVSSFDGTTIEKVTPAGVSSVFASGLSSPSGLAFDKAGNLYVANFGANTIEKITPAGVGTIFASTGMNGPTGIAFDSAGNLYVANWSGNYIEKYNTSGVGSVFAITGLSSPSGLAFDSAGNLYVANFGSTTVEKFTPAGVGSVFANGLDQPSGLAFDNVGNLYVANYGSDTIDEFTPAGVESVFVSSGLNIPLMLTFSAPGVYAQIQNVQSSLPGLAVSGLVNKLILNIANAALGVAVQPNLWLNDDQPTVKGGDTVYAGVFVAEEELEVLLYNNRNNATLSNQIAALIAQLTDAAGTIAITAVSENPTAKYINQANAFINAGNTVTDPGAAIVDYSIAWDLVE